MNDDLPELRVRRALLSPIADAESKADWSDIDELKERASLLRQINEEE